MPVARKFRRSLLGLGLAAGLSLSLLAACGGGGGSGSSGSSYAVGRISGFGSIVVNGVHYDESNASVVDEDGNAVSRDELRLGTVVEVEANEIGESNNVQRASAHNITLSSLIVGPVERVGTGQLVVLGQTVEVTATTVFDDDLAGTLAALVGKVIRVYGALDAATGVYTASRIESTEGAERYRLRGAVAAYDVAAHILRIGDAQIDVSNVSVPPNLQVGSLVRVKLRTTRVNGVWVAVSLKLGLFEPQDNDHTELEGVITAFSSTSSFSVDGLPVDASQARFPDGTAGIVAGARVEVEGAIVNGTLVATKVEIKTEEQDEHDGFEVEGVISAVDVAAASFVVHGVTVNYAGNVAFEGGTAADLAIGTKVEVHATLAADQVTLMATRIKIER